MRSETDEQVRPLRTGLTTGCCATACALAAARFLLTGDKLETVQVTLPKGKQVTLTICEYDQVIDDSLNQAQTNHKHEGIAAATIKDAGDDPDVTHQAKIFTHIKLLPNADNAEIIFKAAKGVGTVTRVGLALAVGEPAINPVPRKMITDHLLALAHRVNYRGGFEVSVGVVDGEALALKTMNGRLGILGGLSILGTTGIVRPFSCSAYIASIHQGIDVARSNGVTHMAASTGNSSEAFIANHYQLPDIALLEMGDFVGAVLKYLKRNPIDKLSICGGFGKVTKLAQGHMDLHSRSSSIDFSYLAQCAEAAGANDDLLQHIHKANTSIEVLALCQSNDIALAERICLDALTFVKSVIPNTIEAEVWAIDRKGELVGKANECSA